MIETHTPDENVKSGTAAPDASPTSRVLLLKNHPHFRGKPELPLSRWKRDRLIEESRKQQKFMEKHPWLVQVDPQVRELIRKMQFGLRRAGCPEDEQTLWHGLDILGNTVGPKVILPLLEQFMHGFEFECEGVVLRGFPPPGCRTQATPLIPFVRQHADRPVLEHWEILVVLLFREIRQLRPSWNTSAANNRHEPELPQQPELAKSDAAGSEGR